MTHVSTQPDPSRPRQPPLFGRQREQEVLYECLIGMFGGQGSLVLVGGEAGIGKTTLVNWLAEEAEQRGALVLAGNCYDLTATPPYGPWLDAFERYLSTGDDPPRPALDVTGSSGTPTSFDAVRAFLSRVTASQPVMLVLEDLHWSDPASLDLLRHLARQLATLPALFVGTYRDVEIAPDHPLFQMLPLLVREARAERIDLRRLDSSGIQSSIDDRYLLPADDRQRLVSYVERFSDGNPLYLTELLRTLEAERLLRPAGEQWTLAPLTEPIVPPLLRQIIAGRLTRLDDETRAALAIAAVIGHDLPLGLWRAVSGLTDEQLSAIVVAAVDAHLLEEKLTGDGLRFSHALVRAAIYGSVPLPRRRNWHRLVAEALAASTSPSPDNVAYHFREAGDGRAVVWFVRAGIRARRAGAWITAAERFAAATQLEGDDVRTQERGWLLFMTAYMLRHSDSARSIEAFDAAEQLAAIAGDSVLTAYINYSRGAERCQRADFRRGMRELEAGVAAIDTLLADHHLLGTEEQAMSVIQRLVNGDEGSDTEVEPVRFPSRPPSRVPRPHPRVNLQRGVLINWLGHTGRYREAKTIGAAYLVELQAAFGPDYHRQPQCVSGLHGIGHAYAGLGQIVEARDAFARSRSGAEAANDQAFVTATHWSEQLMVLVPYLTDQPAERVRLNADANRAWERCNGMTIVVAGEGAPSDVQADLLEGRWQRTTQLATDHLTAPWIHISQEAIVVLAILAHRQGAPETAWRHVGQLLPDGPATEPGNAFFPHAIAAIGLAVELALAAGERGTARRWIEMHGRWLDWSGATLWQADHGLLWANWHEQAGNLEDAQHHAEAARTLASTPRQPLRLVAIDRLLGRIATTRREFEQAAALLDRSLTLANACAAPFERARTLLALAELRVAKGQPDEARALLDDARAICQPLDARPTLERIAGLEARIGGTAAPRAPDGLTTRETEVLVLIATGRSNKEIALELGLSIRTVERHINNLYRKIDAQNKADATAYALRQNLA